jgi:hypothetical protein
VQCAVCSVHCTEAEISKNYRPKNSGYNLRLSWCSVHGSHCSNNELGGLIWIHLPVAIMCEGRGLRSASGDRTSGWIHSHGMNKNFASAQSQIRDGIFKLLRSPGIDSASLCSLAGRYDNPIRSLAPMDCSKIPEQLYRLYWEEKNKNMNADVCTLHPHWFYVDGSMVPGYKFWCFTV